MKKVDPLKFQEGNPNYLSFLNIPYKVPLFRIDQETYPRLLPIQFMALFPLINCLFSTNYYNRLKFIKYFDINQFDYD